MYLVTTIEQLKREIEKEGGNIGEGEWMAARKQRKVDLLEQEY